MKYVFLDKERIIKIGRPRKYDIVKKTCVCGTDFETTTKRLEQSRGKFCSKKCSYENKIRPRGLIYNISTVNRGWFKKGQTAPMKGKKRPDIVGGKNLMWKGDKVGRTALHDWVRKRKIKTKYCEKCREQSEMLHLANISYKYKREVEDYKYLCPKCHQRMDRKNGWGKSKEFFYGKGK